MILLIDNYDSFTYNLVQYLGEIGEERPLAEDAPLPKEAPLAERTPQSLIVRRNDKISLDEIRDMQPDAIIISPGPGTPKEAGISVDVIKKFAGKIPILGVCLGQSLTLGNDAVKRIACDKQPREPRLLLPRQPAL